MDPISQSVLGFIAIVIFLCYLDRNVSDWLFLVFIAIPGIHLMRFYWWLRLYPRLELDRLQIFFHRNRKSSVTGGVPVSQRHLTMAKQLLEELQRDQANLKASGRADDDL